MFESHRLQQRLHLVELLLAHARLHLDLTDDPLKSLQPAGRGREGRSKVKKHFRHGRLSVSQINLQGTFLFCLLLLTKVEPIT